MTIRLKCAECQRKLKVPDEALGKKVECPACGARFIGRIDADAPTAPSSQRNGNPSSPFPDLALDKPDDPVMDVTDAVDESAAVEEPEIVPEIVEEEEPVDKSKNRRGKKKSRGSSRLVPAIVAVVLLLACGLGAYFAYLYLF